MTGPSSYEDACRVMVVTVPSPCVVTMVVVGIADGAQWAITGAGATTTGAEIGVADGTTMISVEP